MIAKHGKIDVLKIDIEGQEEGVLRHIPPAMLDKIEIIYSEGVFPDDVLAETHVKTVRGIVAKFVRRDLVGQFRTPKTRPSPLAPPARKSRIVAPPGKLTISSPDGVVTVGTGAPDQTASTSLRYSAPSDGVSE